MEVVLEVVSTLVEFSHIPETFTALSTGVFSLMVQVKVTFVPLYVGCIVVICMVGAGTVKQKRRSLIMKISGCGNQCCFSIGFVLLV